MALTDVQRQALFKASGLQGQAPQSQEQTTNPIISTGQGISDVLRNIGLGAVPQTGSALYETGRGIKSAVTGQNAFQPNSDPFSTDKELQAYSTPQGTAGKAIENSAGLAAWMVGGLNPLGMTGKAMLTRAGIGAASGLGQNIAQGQGTNPVSDALSTLIGGTANTYLPPALSKLGGKVAQIAYGKAGKTIPEIAAATGQVITGAGSKGAKQAQQIIGQKIGDLYDQMGTGMTKDEIFNTLNDTPKLPPTSGTLLPTNLDYFMKENGIPAEAKSQVLSFLKTMAVGPGMRRSLEARSQQSASGTIEKEMNAEINNYLAKNPDIAKAVEQNGIENVSLPGRFWHDLAVTIRPSQKIFDQIAKNPDYQMNLEDKIRMGLSDAIKKGLQTKLGQETPQALPQLQQLNKLYSAAAPIAKGTTKGVLPYHLDIMAQLAALELLGAPLTGQKESPYLQILAPLGFMANPAASGTVASQMATPTANAIINALSSLGASNLSNKLTH